MVASTPRLRSSRMSNERESTLLDISEALVSALLKGYKMAIDTIALKQVLFEDGVTPSAKLNSSI